MARSHPRRMDGKGRLINLGLLLGPNDGNHYIYGIGDGCSDIFYVGRSIDPVGRFCSHRRACSSAKARLENAHDPVLVILEKCPCLRIAELAEREWIERLTTMGMVLENYVYQEYKWQGLATK